MTEKKGYVYILANENNTVLYVGVTSNLVKRIFEHKNNFVEGFTKEYNLKKLIYFEVTESIVSAIVREKQIKGWLRAKKVTLIEEINPNWDDLYKGIV